MARRRIEAGELIVEISNTPDFEVENYGHFHQGICGISNEMSVECTVFFTTDYHLEGLWSSQVVSCNSFLKIYGFGRETAESPVFAVMEKVSRNIVQFFEDRNLKKHQANILASAYDAKGYFLKEQASSVVRNTLMQFYEAVSVGCFPDFGTEGAVTFLVKNDGKNDEVKWLKANPTGNQTEATSELRALFCLLLDIKEEKEKRKEELSFLNFLSRKSSYYHPFVLTEIERERFSYRLEEPIRNIRHSLHGVKLYWLRKVQKYPLQALILKDRVYSDDLLSMTEFLGNFYKHANDRKVIADYTKLLGKSTAAMPGKSTATMPTLTERNTTMRKLFGDGYLSCLWEKLPSDVFDPYNFGLLI